MLKTLFLVVKRIGQRFVIKDILDRKVGSDRPRSFPDFKHDHRLKMTVLKGIRKCLLSNQKFKTAKPNSFSRLKKSRRVKEMGFLSRICGKTFSVVNRCFPLRQLFMVLFYCGAFRANRTKFLV